ncbi:mechanosensitive ion channel family protein [Desulfobaculum sp.]
MDLSTILPVAEFSEWSTLALAWLVKNGLRLPVAIIIFLLGRWVAKLIGEGVSRIAGRGAADQLLANFLSGVTYYTLLTAVGIAALAHLGVNVTSLIAVFGAAGLAVGLALKDSLSNFASGVMLVVFRPFKVGDYVLGAGVAGTVERLTIFNTIMVTPDNQRIIIPNSMLMGDVITNVTANPIRRIDFTFGIAYDDDIDKAKDVVWKTLAKESRILDDPETVVAVHTLGDSSVNLVVRPWVKTEEYWSIYWALMEAIKKAFDAEGITIPFPQRDVHLYPQGEAQPAKQ